MIWRLIKGLICKHSYVWRNNIYGDQIIYAGWKRSIWECEKCERVQFRDKLGGPEYVGRGPGET